MIEPPVWNGSTSLIAVATVAQLCILFAMYRSRRISLPCVQCTTFPGGLPRFRSFYCIRKAGPPAAQ